MARVGLVRYLMVPVWISVPVMVVFTCTVVIAEVVCGARMAAMSTA